MILLLTRRNLICRSRRRLRKLLRRPRRASGSSFRLIYLIRLTCRTNFRTFNNYYLVRRKRAVHVIDACARHELVHALPA